MLLIDNKQSEKYFNDINLNGIINNIENFGNDFNSSKTIDPFKGNLVNNYSKIISETSYGSSWQLLYIFGYDIFPSSENWDLYYTFQKYHGGNGALNSFPGHLFFAHEYNELATMISISLLNCFDAIVVSRNDYSRFHISHHGKFTVYAKDVDIIRKFND